MFTEILLRLGRHIEMMENEMETIGVIGFILGLYRFLVSSSWQFCVGDGSFIGPPQSGLGF